MSDIQVSIIVGMLAGIWTVLLMGFDKVVKAIKELKR